MRARRSLVSAAVLAASLSGAVALAPSASASTEVVPSCSPPGPSGKVCASIVYERFPSDTSIKGKATATSFGPPIVITGVGVVRYINGVKSANYYETSHGRTATTTGGPGVEVWTDAFSEECDLPGRVVRYSVHVSYTASGKSYGVDTGQWGGVC